MGKYTSVTKTGLYLARSGVKQIAGDVKNRLSQDEMCVEV